MSECICVNCPNRCYEYENNGASDKAYYEWTYKEDKCKAKSKEREQILEGFIKICKNGTSKDCRVYVSEAKRKGVSYEELCTYKKMKMERKGEN